MKMAEDGFSLTDILNSVVHTVNLLREKSSHVVTLELGSEVTLQMIKFLSR